MFQRVKSRFSGGVKRVLCPGALRRLTRRQDGTVAVEFAMVAAPFLGLLFAIIETCFVFFAGQTLETATADTSRLILTGQAQSQAFSSTQFKNALCARLFAMFDCQNKVQIDVRTAASFSAADLSKPLDSNKNLMTNPMFDMGSAGQIVIVRVMYPWPVYVSLNGLNLSDMAGGNRLLMATAAFRNEPY